MLQLRVKLHRRTKINVVSWQKPSLGWFKLNVDDNSLGNLGESGASGVLRNEEGRLQFAFAASTRMRSNNQAELLALLFGLHRCKELGFTNVIPELDSLLVVNWLREGRCHLWCLEDYWE